MTVTTGTQAVVILTAQAVGSTGSVGGFMSFSVDGAVPTNAVGDPFSYRVFGNDPVRASAVSLITGLTAGAHIFCAVYREQSPGGAGTSTFSARTITVIPG